MRGTSGLTTYNLVGFDSTQVEANKLSSGWTYTAAFWDNEFHMVSP